MRSYSAGEKSSGHRLEEIPEPSRLAASVSHPLHAHQVARLGLLSGSRARGANCTREWRLPQLSTSTRFNHAMAPVHAAAPHYAQELAPAVQANWCTALHCTALHFNTPSRAWYSKEQPPVPQRYQCSCCRVPTRPCPGPRPFQYHGTCSLPGWYSQSLPESQPLCQYRSTGTLQCWRLST
jgi:hypothetical protein